MFEFTFALPLLITGPATLAADSEFSGAMVCYGLAVALYDQLMKENP